MQRFGRKVVYVVIGDGVEEEQAAKKVMEPRNLTMTPPPPRSVSSDWTKPAFLCCRGFVLVIHFFSPVLLAVAFFSPLLFHGPMGDF